MTTYTVESIVSSEQKPKKAGGTFTKYLLELQGQGQVGLADFSGLNPRPGQTIDGYEIRDEGFGPELKKAGSAPRSNGKKPSGDKGYGYQTNPVDAKRMNRAHSQDMALQAMALGHKIGVTTVQGPMDGDEFRKRIKAWTDWFEKDTNA